MWMNALFLLTSCSSNPTIKATVVDIWDKPVPSATIVQEGVVERIAVDGQGLAEIEDFERKQEFHDESKGSVRRSSQREQRQGGG